jgi:hypothetical protein
MANISFTTTTLINRIKRWYAFPTSQQTFENQDIVDFINDELNDVIVPTMLDLTEEFFIKNKDITIVSGQEEYEIPTRAIGFALRDVEIVNDTNKTFISLPRINPSLRHNSQHHGRHSGFFIRSNNVVLLDPDGVAGETLRLSFPQRPNQVVLETDCGQVSSFDAVAKTITLKSVPTSWTTATILDIIKDQPTFDNLAEEVTISNISTNTLTVSEVPSDLAVDDWVCETQRAPLAQIPIEAQNLLCQSVVVKIAEAMADEKGMQQAGAKFRQTLEKLTGVLTPRVEGENKKVINPQNFNRIRRRFGFYSFSN